MPDYAQIINGKVNLIVVENDQIADQIRNVSPYEIINIENEDPKPSTGWEYDGNAFIEPSFEFATIVDNSVTSIDTMTYTVAQPLIEGGTLLVDITYIEPKPEVGWTYTDGQFSAP